MKPLLLILNPRRIESALASYETLHIDRAYLTGFRECELSTPISDLIDKTDYSHYLIISDDTIATQRALEKVLILLLDHPVATGWCNLDPVEAIVNLQRSPLKLPEPDGNWDFCHFAEILGHPEPAMRTHFAGHCLTGMSRDLWKRFPFGCYGEPGGSSDYHLCWRLQEAEIPIVAARDGFLLHLKERWRTGDTFPKFIGPQHQEVRLCESSA